MSVAEPAKITTPWADTGSKKPIPQNSNNATGAAGYDKGFPDITMTPPEAGGIPPAGQDFNGIFYEVTKILRYMQAGGQPTFSVDMATAIGGYPKGAVILGSDGLTLWQSQVDSNSENPDTSPANWKKVDVGLRSDLWAASGPSLIGTQSGMTLADYLLKGAGIDPDMFPGPMTDAARMQAAIDLWATDKTRYIALHRAYVVTGSTIRVANIETESPERSLVIIGGELVKLDTGCMFDKPTTGQTLATSEVRFIGTKFRGPNVAGTYIVNGHNDLNGTYDSAHMMRVSFVGCFGTGIQVAYAKPTGYLQSITMDANCVWRKWAGYLFDCGWMYDVQCLNPRIEAGDAVWVTREVNADPACSGCNFLGGNVEGLSGVSGPAFDVGVCIGTTISPAYMEANAGGDINCSKGTGFHKGLTIMGVKMEPTSAQAANTSYYSVRLGKGAEGAFNLGGNFSTSNMYDCTPGNEAVVIDHSSFVTTGKKLFSSNVLRRFEPTGTGFHGQLADGYGVGALYEFRLFYVDGIGADHRRYTGFGDAAPTAASHPGITFGRGSMIFNRYAGLQDRQYGVGTARSALIHGWQCIASGAPGTWIEVAIMMPY